jgi:hypothetical protein
MWANAFDKSVSKWHIALGTEELLNSTLAYVAILMQPTNYTILFTL